MGNISTRAKIIILLLAPWSAAAIFMLVVDEPYLPLVWALYKALASVLFAWFAFTVCMWIRERLHDLNEGDAP